MLLWIWVEPMGGMGHWNDLALEVVMAPPWHSHKQLKVHWGDVTPHLVPPPHPMCHPTTPPAFGITLSRGIPEAREVDRLKARHFFFHAVPHCSWHPPPLAAPFIHPWAPQGVMAYGMP